LQIWDRALHQNIPWVTKTAQGAIAVAAATGVIAAFTEFDNDE
jgi:hypothetical protein